MNVVTGFIFLIAIAVSSRWKALWSVAGAVIAMISGFVFGMPVVAIAAGIAGYNAVLCAIAVSEDRLAFSWGIVFTSVLSVLILLGFGYGSLAALTAPFVLSTWVYLLVRKSIGHARWSGG